MKHYILALDQGTTSSRAILFNKQQEIVAMAQTELTQIYPKPGWVEQDPMEIWATQLGVLNQVIAKSGIAIEDIDSIGITNQRETTIVWNKLTGKPVYNAIVWQCRRTASIAQALIDNGQSDLIRDKTGLMVDAYFSGTKIKWILDNVPGAREQAERGELMFGTVDTWLVYNLTNQQTHLTDVTNASRTMLYNIHSLAWDASLLELLDIPCTMMPEVRSSSEVYGHANLQGHLIPIAGIAGDQQAALFGQYAFNPGEAKNTYGTGCFLLMNTGTKPVVSENGLLTTIAVGIDGRVEYALEGSIFVGGALIQWLRDELGLIREAKDSEYFANKVEDSNGVYIVPAFTGLGASYWDMEARGTITGITRGTRREHIIRAALEAIALQSHDVLRAMEKDSDTPLIALRVDGGASANDFLMQFQADVLGIPVQRPQVHETTALGAALLSGLATGFFESKEAIKAMTQNNQTWMPQKTDEEKATLLKGWKQALKQTLTKEIAD